MATEKMTAMLLQNLDENTNTELQNTENGSQKIWPKRLKDQPAFAIREIVPYEVLCENIFWKTSSNLRENIFDEVFLSKIAGLLACKVNIKDSITGIFLSICEIRRNSRTVFSLVQTLFTRVVQRCSIKNLLANSQENTCGENSF